MSYFTTRSLIDEPTRYRYPLAAERPMAKAVRTSTRSGNRRGSPEAVAKRRAGRSFNDVLSAIGGRGGLSDGRTEKRRQRLLKELEDGKSRTARELKPLDILLRVQELLDLGEPAASLRKVLKSKKRASLTGPEIVDAVKKLHKAYAFRPEVYGFVGIDLDVLALAGVAPTKRRAKQA
jgi:hypothetical protein